MKYRRLTSQSGAILISIILVLPFLTILALYSTQLAANNFIVSRKDQFHTHAQLAADAGVDYAMNQIQQNAAWAGSTTEVEVHNGDGVRTTFTATSQDVTATKKQITAVGRSYRIGGTQPQSTISLLVDLRPVTSGEYGVVSGVGGLIMSNSAKILGGDVLVNGKITMSNTAQIGLSTNPVNLEVAHQSCPASGDLSTYPRLCNSGENGQPITITNSAKIYGTVKANNQTNGTAISSPGLQSPYCLVPTAGPNCVTPGILPDHNRAAQLAAITSTQTGGSQSCSSGTKVWPANMKITGDVLISNSCKVTVNGNIWITGKLELKNSAELIVANSMGATRPVIIVDGTIADFSQTSVLRSNSSSTGFQIINYYSSNACTTQNPGCTITGSDLSNSRDLTTIQFDNSASGPNTVFYSRWSKVLVKNSGQIGALVGQTVELRNSGTLTFGTSIGTGTSFWVIDGYRRSY